MTFLNARGVIAGIFMTASVAGPSIAEAKPRVAKDPEPVFLKVDREFVSAVTELCKENAELIERNDFKPPFENHRAFLIDVNRMNEKRLAGSGFDSSACRLGR